MATIENPFENNRDYQNVYFLKIDAAGHSAIMLANPYDRAQYLYDAFENEVINSLEEARRNCPCDYADLWSWQGDGGLVVIWDHARESRTLDTALATARLILDQSLPALQRRLRMENISGAVHIRMALHKGGIRYRTARGSIHSPAINFVSHLEAKAPRDTLVISEEIFRILPNDRRIEFQRAPFPFEGSSVYFDSRNHSRNLFLQWYGAAPFHGSQSINTLSERPTPSEKSQLIQLAQHEVIDLGVTLGTGSNYLVVNQTPGDYPAAVHDLLQRGGRFTALLLDPDSPIARQYDKTYNDNCCSRGRETLSRYRMFHDSLKGELQSRFRVMKYLAWPQMAALAIDPHHGGLIMHSPYLTPLDRRESPHYVTTEEGAADIFVKVRRVIDYYLQDAQPYPLGRDSRL
ncbi:MAG: hypothetical protein HQL73_07380 [Magnetococcales bacterium]|nr:hypothetical protein [Magnetococcales bacterium]